MENNFRAVLDTYNDGVLVARQTEAALNNFNRVCVNVLFHTNGANFFAGFFDTLCSINCDFVSRISMNNVGENQLSIYQKALKTALQNNLTKIIYS
jgi:hypothetical protein